MLTSIYKFVTGIVKAVMGVAAAAVYFLLPASCFLLPSSIDVGRIYRRSGSIIFGVLFSLVLWFVTLEFIKGLGD